MTRIFIIFLLLYGLKASSCSCNDEFSEFTPYFFSFYNRVFVCKPISVDTAGANINYRAVVSKTYWGQKQDTVNITTARINGMCGQPLDLNDIYLIYGTGNAVIHIDHCGPSRKLTDVKDTYLDNGTVNDSLRMRINGVYKKYSFPFIKDYFAKAASLEIKYLETISETSVGKIITQFSNGLTSAEINIKDGMFNGPSTFYYPNGKPKLKCSFANNSKDSIGTEYVFKTVRGKDFYISWTGNYIDNRQRGKWKGKMLIGTFKEFSAYYGYNLNKDYE